ncbi:MAG: type II toxin-antitoxin system PemK/MazF family toxin [Patescibacteria group bacterium]|nr:type II toxin-antitoxin system PemK/MazF family toxin [Patescibacteria group bacterium]MBU1160732.1 type II toxin-antitoxin system PemK/MazF family toxin [Patescibacteria group bacterium]MBU1987230.1 type II toxin-antitoxin system PemK/MazF family toxin [Patescibacteria group bacterium]
MFEKGIIILVPFPFTDLSANKVRPALIVSNNLFCENNVVVVFISSKTKKNLQKTDFIIQNSDKNFVQTGLKMDSIVRINKIATLDKKIVLGELGNITKQMQKEIDAKLKLLFDL